ncbi:MAG TPA: hypothetical protein VFQ44_17725 [Streptosporangiaceae bacterium]|nr:hypothetical protein [Streptosporangiaceae bacterium]
MPATPVTPAPEASATNSGQPAGSSPDELISEAAEGQAGADQAASDRADADKADADRADADRTDDDRADADGTDADGTDADGIDADGIDADGIDAHRADADGAGGGLAADKRPTHWRQAATLLIAAVVLAGFAAWAAVSTHNLRAGQEDPNIALTDKALTKQVTTQVSDAVRTIFSYSYANPDATKQAAQHLLTGSAISQYNKLFALVEQKAPAEKLVLTTKVTDVGVELLTSNRARLLVFVNQQDKAGSGQAVYSGAMFAVTALRHGARWQIGNINTFTSSG